MTWDQIESQWQDVEERFFNKFKELSIDKESLPARRDDLSAALQAKRGYSKQEADLDLEEWKNSLIDEDAIPTSTSGAPTY